MTRIDVLDVYKRQIPAGECIGRIKSILTVQEVVDEIINGTEALLKKLAFG